MFKNIFFEKSSKGISDYQKDSWYKSSLRMLVVKQSELLV